MRDVVYNAWRGWLAGLPPLTPFVAADYLAKTYATASPAVTQGQLKLTKLIGPFAQPVLIDGLRFRAESGNVQFSTDEALSLRARVSAGPFSLSNDFINPAAVAVREQYAAGEMESTTACTSVIFGTSSSFAEVNFPGGSYTWHFDEPLYLPAGVPLRISLKRFGDARDDYYFSTVSSGIGLGTYAALYGRYLPMGALPPPGNNIPVPYAGTFNDPTIPSTTEPAVAQVTSLETDLNNQTSGLLYASKLIGRLPARDSTGQSVGEYSGPEPLIRITRTYSGGRGADGYGYDAFARANHRAIIDPMKPFNAVFDLQTRSIDLAGVALPPGAAFIATILKRTNQNSTLGALVRVYPAIGLTGFRMERWQ